jgi:hypothetical protein
MKIVIPIISTLTIALIFGCAAQPQPEEKNSIGNEKLSHILLRIKNTTSINYSLSSSDILFPEEEVSGIKKYDDLAEYLTKKGYVSEIVANKYRTDLPKIIEVHEKGKYAGSLSTIPYSPLIGKKFADVALDVGMLIKFTIIMDADVLAENERAALPSSVFRGTTVADYLGFCEKMYDYDVNIDTSSAIITIKKYKPVVINVLADRSKIQKDSNVFMAEDIENKKVKQFVADNGKIFMNATPSAIEKARRYADEINSINANKIMVAFDGKKSVSGVIAEIARAKKKSFTLSGNDFIPEKDSGIWFESSDDVDEYLRKSYNKKLTRTSALDTDHDGIEDTFTFNIVNIQGIPLSSPTTITSFFKQLGNLDGNDYIVDGDSNIPITKSVIDDFEHLRAYLWSSAGVKISVTDSGRGLPKIIKVDNK